MKILICLLLLLLNTFNTFSQEPGIPALRIFTNDKTTLTFPVKNIDSMIHLMITPAKLLTLNIAIVTNTSAKCEANVISNGESTISKMGFCISTKENPTIESKTVFSTNFNGSKFSSNLFGLIKNTKYFIRAFAYNDAGLSYGNQVECITLNTPDTVLNDTIIGTQVWTTKNLDITKYRNGDAITQVNTIQEWANANAKQEGAWCYYNFDPKNGELYGKLYNWHAVNDPRGLAPDGYHIPSDEEWNLLVDYLGGIDSAVIVMKSNSGWFENGNGNNKSGFTGLPGGFLSTSGAFYDITELGTWWSSTEFDKDDAWGRNLNYKSTKVGRFDYNKIGYLSIRCLKD